MYMAGEEELTGQVWMALLKLLAVRYKWERARGQLCANVIHSSVSLSSVSTFISFPISFNLKTYIKMPVSKHAGYKMLHLP